MFFSSVRGFLWAALVACSPVGSAPLNPACAPVTGVWKQGRELLPFLWQQRPVGKAVAFCPRLTGAQGAWRAWVQPGLGAREAGIWFQGDAAATTGFLAGLGGNPGVGGFLLESAGGEVLWEDRWAPWEAYHAYLVEGVVEREAVRVQLFASDGKTLVSQSPWVSVPLKSTETPGQLGFYTRDGGARFWRPEHARQPLSPVVADAPNKRRLQDENSPWTVLGPGTWRWTTSARKRVRQYASVERTTVINRQLKGALRSWECRLQLDPGAGGAGMLFQTNERADRGLLAWLGGTFGSGTLMLYELPLTALWTGRQGNWHYSKEYVLRAETKPGKARVQLLAADGKVIQDSHWVPVSEEVSTRPGYLGFQTWKGTGEFWGFSAGTRTAASAPSAARGTGAPGPHWELRGDATWRWVEGKPRRLRQTAREAHGMVLVPSIDGNLGLWRCHVRVDPGARQVGLLFQVSRDLKQGFALLLTNSGVRLESMDGRRLWEEPAFTYRPGVDYILEGRVLLDRVAARVLAAAGATVLVRSEEIYVPDTNNDRTGFLGFRTRRATAEFWKWEHTEPSSSRPGKGN